MPLHHPKENQKENKTKPKLWPTDLTYNIYNKKEHYVMEHTNNFSFLLFKFSDFILILFLFDFLLDNEEACDTAVT